MLLLLHGVLAPGRLRHASSSQRIDYPCRTLLEQLQQQRLRRLALAPLERKLRVAWGSII